VKPAKPLNRNGTEVLNKSLCTFPIKFLELSGVGRVMADGTDEDGARATRIVAWDATERVAPRGEG
jgi:hypothetical protein